MEYDLRKIPETQGNQPVIAQAISSKNQIGKIVNPSTAKRFRL